MPAKGRIRPSTADQARRFEPLARISHTATGEGGFWRAMALWRGLDGRKAFWRELQARGGGRRIGGAVLGYVDCALSGSSARRCGEPDVGDPEFALVGEG